ncbi:hypothetical protein ABIB40_002074 [Pedobacter sp. UYP30]|uniref:hypothetical protein n=1 Tax=Pedobacter sp. UYP30 TaxID=1756400 RepID=UPI00339AD734
MSKHQTSDNVIDRQFMQPIQIAISKGIDYLYEHQFPNGEFCAYLSPDEQMQEWCHLESNVFCTAVISSCLLKLEESEKRACILEKSGSFLAYEMMRGGLWNFFTKSNARFKAVPADADTTAYTSFVLQQLGIDFPDNKSLLLENTDKNGLFYTWIVLRHTSTFSFLNLKVVGREFKRPFHALFFWLKHEVKRRDIDAVVNANALYYVGLNEKTEVVVKFLTNLLRESNEENSDKWYKNPIVFYYFVSRNYLKVKALEPAKGLILKRLLKKGNTNGGFGRSDLENAMAIATLLNFEHKGPELDNAVIALLAAQNEAGYWRRSILFYTGPSKSAGWGSEETTTGFCLEALAMYKAKLSINL